MPARATSSSTDSNRTSPASFGLLIRSTGSVAKSYIELEPNFPVRDRMDLTRTYRNHDWLKSPHG